MEKVRIGAAIILAIIATSFMVNMDEYTAAIFRNSLNGWFGQAGMTVGTVVFWIYVVAVCAFMSIVSYTVIFIFERGLKE